MRRCISSILRGVVTPTQNVSEYMLLLALCLVPDIDDTLTKKVDLTSAIEVSPDENEVSVVIKFLTEQCHVPRVDK